MKYKYQIVKGLILLGIAILYLNRSFHDFKEPFIKGDGIEYIMMTEAFKNHFTPDMRVKDLETFRKRYHKYHGWENPMAPKVIDVELEYFKHTENLYKEGTMGFYCNKNKKWHCAHFFFYSLVNLPSYIIAKNFGPIRSFYFTNAFFVILACFVILFFTPFSIFIQILSALCFCFSACYWYLGWQHAEVFTASLIAISMVALFNKRTYLAIVILALACLQNQPLIILLALFCLIALKQKGFNFRNVIRTGLLSAIAFIPPIYYYINFGVTNMINEAGFLDTKYITINRVTGFYTDLSQGMILTIPLILLMYLPLIGLEIRKMLKKETSFDFTIFIPLAVLGISITVSTMGNWNHGMAIINRYASWASIVVMMHVFYLSDKLQLTFKTVLFNYFFATQFFTTIYHQRFNKYDWSSGAFTPLAKWTLSKYPELYNPDPFIFAGRTPSDNVLLPENSPIIYFSKKKVKKVMVHRSKLNDLVSFGISKEQLAKLKDKVVYNYDWGYINETDFVTSLKDEEIYFKIRERKLAAVRRKIESSYGWMKLIEEKAKNWNLPVEEVVRRDAEYSVAEGEKVEDSD